MVKSLCIPCEEYTVAHREPSPRVVVSSKLFVAVGRCEVCRLRWHAITKFFKEHPTDTLVFFVIRVLAFWVHQRVNPKSVLQFSDLVLWKKFRKKISLTHHVSTGDSVKK
jgi:hypothetical protein